MVFSAPVFLFAFLPVAVIAGVVAPRSLRNGLLLALSLAFYWWGSGLLTLLLLASIVGNHAAIRALGRTDDPGRRGRIVAAAVTANLALLGYYKYVGFAVTTIGSVARVDVERLPGWADVALPIGISFFTFQAISAVVDVARGSAALGRLRDTGLFVSFFPQLIAGPIVRYDELAPQLRDRRIELGQAAGGAVRFVHGLAKKVLVADSVAVLADTAFGLPDPTFADAWIGALAYTVQIYFDFSGYSDMAIGIAAIVGFTLPENFRRPYSAVSVTDFWRRWHMTLSRWFRDYVYIPLGGSRVSTLLTYRNLVAVFLLTGLWHGAAWTFVLWGAYHGAWLVLERVAGFRDGLATPAVGRAVTLLAVIVGWVLFRAPDLGTAATFLTAMVQPGTGTSDVLAVELGGVPRLALLAGLATALVPGDAVAGPWLAARRGPVVAMARVGVLAVVLPMALVAALNATFSPFLYFQF